MKTEITIVIPAYNARKWIGDTLRSITAEDMSTAETIVVDDGSCDGTSKLISRDFPWVRLVRQDNYGCSVARSRGTKLAIGEFIKYLDSDDLLAPGVLRRQLEIARSTGADCVYGCWQELRKSTFGNWEAGPVNSPSIDTDIELCFFDRLWCVTAAYLWRKEFLLKKHPGWHLGLPVIQDARFVFDAARADCKFVHDRELSAIYRVHESGSVSSTSREKFLQDCLVNCLEIEEIWRLNQELSKERSRAVCDCLAGIARNGTDSQMKTSLENLFRIDPNYRPDRLGRFSKLARAIGLRNAIRFARRLRPSISGSEKRIALRNGPNA